MFKKYVMPKKAIMIYTLIVKMISTVFGIAIPTLLAHIVDKVVPTGDRNMVVIMGLLMLGCAFLEWVLGVYSNRVAARISSNTIKEIRQDLFDRSINLSQKQIDKFGISSIESRLTSDTYTVHNFLGTALRMGARSIMLFVGGIFFCISLSPRLSVVIIGLVFPLFFAIRLIHSKTQPLWKGLRERVDNMVQVIREAIRGIKVSKALNSVSYQKSKFETANNQVKQRQIKASDLSSITSPVATTLLYGGLFVVILYGGKLVSEDVIKVGIIIAFISYFMQITQSLFMMDWMFNLYNQATTSMKRIDEILFLDLDKNQKVENPIKLPDSNPEVAEIEFKNVFFTYKGVKEGLKDISFKVFPRQSLGLMGKTGAGKSTIIKLLLRQYDVDRGEILVRGVNIKNIEHSELNKLFGSVFQRDFLFKGSIRENIDFGRNLSDEQIYFATENAQAYEFIKEKENNLSHELASKGVNLSGGQKQRVLISRAFASNPSILILDDSSSALDYRTDSKLREAINNNFKQTTSIIIAQRISSVINSDQIIFLENGMIKAKGNHEYMLENSEEYREIAQMQIGDEK